jgi:exonuclease VII small subunit
MTSETESKTANPENSESKISRFTEAWVSLESASDELDDAISQLGKGWDSQPQTPVASEAFLSSLSQAWETLQQQRQFLCEHLKSECNLDDQFTGFVHQASVLSFLDWLENKN